MIYLGDNEDNRVEKTVTAQYALDNHLWVAAKRNIVSGGASQIDFYPEIKNGILHCWRYDANSDTFSILKNWSVTSDLMNFDKLIVVKDLPGKSIIKAVFRRIE